MLITPLTLADIPEMLHLWRTTEQMILRDADSPEALARYFERNPGLSLGARIDGRLVGAVLCGHDGRRGYLNHLAVAVDLRRRGIARALVERCLAALAEQGIDKCHLFVFVENEAARAFWSHLGWKERNDVRQMSFVTSGKATA